MASTVDLEDLVPDLEVALNVPGENAYSNMSPEQWVGYLRNGFWEAVLDGLLDGYTESDGVITPTSGSVAMPRDLQQLIIMYTGISVLRNRLFGLQTVFHAKAGPVEYEVQQSAQVMKALLDDFSSRRAYIIDKIANNGGATDIAYIDTFLERQSAINQRYTVWVND